MYLGVDVGGTKTLLASFDNSGKVTQEIKFPTPQIYDEFLAELANNVAKLSTKQFHAACTAVPGRLDRAHGSVLSLGNLPWENRPIEADTEKVFNCPAIVENDANLAGLSEAMLHKEFDSVLYITVSTGIGTGAVYKQRLNPELINSEGGQMIVPHNGKLERWEKFASGHAFYEYFGKFGSDVPASDTKTWGLFAHNLAVGFFELIAVVEPDLIVIGGSMGDHFDKYSKLLDAELDKFSVPVVKRPKIVEAKRPDEAVVYGCYELAQQRFPANTSL